MEYYIEDTQEHLNALQGKLMESETYFHLLQSVNALNELNGFEVFNMKRLKIEYKKFKKQKTNVKYINQKSNLEYQNSNIKNETPKNKYEISNSEYQKAYMKLLS